MLKIKFLIGLCCFFAFASTASAQADYSEYGKKLSIGVSLFDGFGIPVRYIVKDNVLEAGLYIGGVAHFENAELVDIYYAPMIGAGYTFFGDRYLKERRGKDKIKANGICVRVNQMLGDYSATIPSLSWARESFKEGRTKRSFNFELGIQYLFPHFEDPALAIGRNVGIRLRCQWNFYLK